MVENMQMVNILGPRESLNDIIAVCMDSGCFHLEDKISGNKKGFTVYEENPYAENLRIMKEIMDHCGVEVKNDLCYSEKSEAIEENSEYLTGLLNKLNGLQSTITANTEKIENLKEKTKKISNFVGLDLNVHNAIHSKYLKVRFGRLSLDGYEKIKEYQKNYPYIFFTPCSFKEKSCYGIYMAPTDKIIEADRIFSSLFFERLILPDDIGEPEELIEIYKNEIKQSEEEVKKAKEGIDGFFKTEGDNFWLLYAALKRKHDIFECRKYAANYKDNYISLTGFVPKSEFDGFKKLFKNIKNVSILDVDASKAENMGITPPTKLKNMALWRPFKFFVEIYGVPGYNEIDPPAFLAITYTLLYGVMFADVGQGIILALVGLWMYKCKNMDLGKPLIPCGIAGTLFGFVFGSVFGYEEVLDPVYKALGFANGAPFKVMSNAVNLLAVSVGIGVVLTCMALILGIFANFKKKDYGSALFGANGIAGFVLYASFLAIVGNMLLKLNLSTGLLVGIILLIIVLIFMHEPLGELVSGNGFKMENPGDFILENFFELFEVLLGYFTNTISFLRVGAFVLIHAGMMMAFSALADMVGGGIGGIIMMVFGNIFVIALEGLLVGIQVLRLEFYEMFSRFYNGEGVPFTPLKVKEN